MESSQPFPTVTIDGGAASGKSSTARALGRRFGLLHVDTGAFYRTVTLALMEAGVSPREPERVANFLHGLVPSTVVRNGQAIMLVNGKDYSSRLREIAVNENVSRFSAMEEVRSYLLAYQRNQVEVARRHGYRGLVAEGRDIGTVIFPHADFRFFLLADERERQRRRELQGETDAIGKRDAMDSGRRAAPLICPPGAVSINSTGLSLQEVIREMSRVIETKLFPTDPE